MRHLPNPIVVKDSRFSHPNTYRESNVFAARAGLKFDQPTVKNFPPSTGYSCRVPTADAVSSTAAAVADFRVRGVSRLNCLILYNKAL